MADELFGELLNISFSFEEFLRAFIRNQIDFLTKNREIFKVVIKEILYREEFKKELFPPLSEVTFNHLTKVIEVYKQRWEIKNLPNESIIKLLSTVLGGYFITNLIFLDKHSISENEIEETIFFIINGLGKSF